MQALRNINRILNQQIRTDNPKRVTFADPIPEPRVPAYKTSNANQAHPRTLPRVVDAQAEKCIGESVELSCPRRSERHAAISQLTDFAAAMQIMQMRQSQRQLVNVRMQYSMQKPTHCSNIESSLLTPIIKRYGISHLQMSSAALRKASVIESKAQTHYFCQQNGKTT